MDGRYYGINVWTKLFAKSNKATDEEGNQIPDMLVAELSRDCIEKSISEILNKGRIENELNISTFNLRFIDPYRDYVDLENSTIDSLKNELSLELHLKHKLFNLEYKLIARKINNDDIILKLNDGRIAVVHLTWKSNTEIEGYPITRIYDNEVLFWESEMRKDVLDYN